MRAHGTELEAYKGNIEELAIAVERKLRKTESEIKAKDGLDGMYDLGKIAVYKEWLLELKYIGVLK